MLFRSGAVVAAQSCSAPPAGRRTVAVREPHPVSLQRLLVGVLTVVTGLLLQVTVLDRLPLPGSAPELLVVVVAAFALTEGPLSGLVTGFGAGLLVDAVSDHQLGRTALALALAGYVTGLIEDDTERSTLLPFAAVALAAVTALAVFVTEGVLLGDSRVSVHAVLIAAFSSVPYADLLTPFVVPVVAGMVRRLDADPLRR